MEIYAVDSASTYMLPPEAVSEYEELPVESEEYYYEGGAGVGEYVDVMA